MASYTSNWQWFLVCLGHPDVTCT